VPVVGVGVMLPDPGRFVELPADRLDIGQAIDRPELGLGVTDVAAGVGDAPPFDGIPPGGAPFCGLEPPLGGAPFNGGMPPGG
jgi:hypothetical protein